MYSVKVKDVIPLEGLELLVFFEDGAVKKFDVAQLLPEYPEFEALKDRTLFEQVRVEPGGYGVSWNENLDCSEGELYANGVVIPLSQEDFYAFVRHNVLNAKEACEILDCTKQNLDSLVKRGSIVPIKNYPKGRLFLRSDIAKRKYR